MLVFRRFLPPLQRIRSRTYHFQAELLDELSDRGLISQLTRGSQLAHVLKQERQVVYVGVDPTAKALHIGHLLPFVCLLHFQLRGHRTVSVIGGATGLVGDPSGRLTERSPLEQQKAEYNVANLTVSIKQFFKNALPYAHQRLQHSKKLTFEPEVINNMDWFKDLSFLDFLTTTGRHARLNTMIARESVQARLSSQQGISFTEFTYQLMQAYDFYHLHDKISCTVQIGGSDQWGNIVAGLELIHRKREERKSRDSGPLTSWEDATHLAAYGITTPLLTTSSGAKLGKSEGNALWLVESLSSVLDFYQFFLGIADSDVGNYLRMFTLLPLHEITTVMGKQEAAPEKRIAQRLLADEVTEMVHGVDGVRRARVATVVLFEKDLSGMSAKDLLAALSGDPRMIFCEESEIIGVSITKLATSFQLVKSRKEALRMTLSRGLYLNNLPIKEDHTLEMRDMIDKRVAIIRAGKDKHLILAIK